MKRKFASASALFVALALGAQSLPDLPQFPEIPEPMPENMLKLADSPSFEEAQLDIPIAPGPFQSSWASIEENYPDTPEWLREAKFGIWVHFGPLQNQMDSRA